MYSEPTNVLFYQMQPESASFYTVINIKTQYKKYNTLQNAN